MATKKLAIALSEVINTSSGIALSAPLTLSATGIVQKKLLISLDALGRGATAPALVRLGSFAGYEFDIGDDSHFSFEPPADWQIGTDIKIHVYWYCGETYASHSGEVRWQGIYACVPDDKSETVDAPTHTATVNSGDINLPANAKTLTYGVLTIPAADIAVVDVIGILFSRVALGGGSNPTAKPTIVRVEIYYDSNKLGE